MAQLLTDSDLNGILREKFAGPGGALRLAQVITEVFGAKHPDGITIQGPVRIVQPPDGDLPALVVTPAPGAQTPATIIPGGSGGGGLAPGQIVFPSPPVAGSLPPNLPIVLYGVIQSGTGTNYTVRCWMAGPGGLSMGDFSCVHPNIDPSETIPPLTPCFIWAPIQSGFIAGPFIIMNVPVFLPES